MHRIVAWASRTARSSRCAGGTFRPPSGRGSLRVRASKTNPDAAREDYRLLVGAFAATVEALRVACEPDDGEPVVWLSARRVNRRIKALAERAGLAGVSSHSARSPSRDGAVGRYFGGG